MKVEVKKITFSAYSSPESRPRIADGGCAATGMRLTRSDFCECHSRSLEGWWGFTRAPPKLADFAFHLLHLAQGWCVKRLAQGWCGKQPA